jgi:predicted nucleotidyltransferase
MAKMTLDELVAQLQKAFGDGLRAVVLYGSAAAGELLDKRSDYNVLVIADALDMGVLDREAAIARAWAEAGNPPPLTLTAAEWRSSADVFAMEYADILERHKVLYGTPPFDGIDVNRDHLRLQLEREAMGKLLQLRQGIIASGGERKRQSELLAESLSTFMVLFRALMRLHGEVPSTDYERLCAQVTARSGIDTGPFVRVVQHARGRTRLSDQDVPAVLSAYLAGAQQLESHIDQLGAR